MLLRFSIENFRSFKEPITFSMIATNEKQHKNHLKEIKKYKTKILTTGAIYGGNAAGKSNLIKALDFVQKFVVDGRRVKSFILRDQFKLDSDSKNKPSLFSFELYLDEYIYELSFSINESEVLEEKLVKFYTTKEEVLYHRKGQQYKFSKELKDKDILEYIRKSTRENQLFLTSSIQQNRQDFFNIYNWFKNSLTLIFSFSGYGLFHKFYEENDPLQESMSEWLSYLDTGISEINGIIIPYEHAQFFLGVDNDFFEQARESWEQLPEDAVQNIRTNGGLFTVKKENGETVIRKLMAAHQGEQGKIFFDFSDESDGTQRLFDLLPAFCNLYDSNSTRTYFIDELDRSLHSELLTKLLDRYLSQDANSHQSQLIFTTHDVLLFDQRLFRRDELWLIEKDASNGQSNIASVSDFKDVRYDKDLRKSYLLGRFGGVPKIQLPTANEEKSEEATDELE